MPTAEPRPRGSHSRNSTRRASASRSRAPRLERKLREQLEEAKDRCAALERRISRAIAAADAANALADDLAALHQALTDDDLGNGA